MTAPVRFPRGRRTALAVLVALVLLLLGAATGYLAVLLALGRPVPATWLTSLANLLRDNPWGAPAVLWVGVGIGAVGLLVTAAALLPAPRHLVELAGPDAHTAAALPARSLRRTLSASATGVDGISGARARIRRRSVRLELTTGLRHVRGLQSAAESAARSRLDALQPRRSRVVTSHLSRRES